MSEPILAARDVRVSIGGNSILHGADLAVSAGELVAVVGPNGAGKSTLARAAAGLQSLAGGSVTWYGEDVGKLRGRRLARTRAYVPQRARVPDGVTVLEAVRIGRSPHLRPLQRLVAADHEAVARAMDRAGVADFAGRQLSTLSGGELQRVQIAVGLAQETPVLMADEPTSALDLGATAGLARLLRDLVEHHDLAVVLVVHDLALAAAVADTVVVVSGGRTVAAGPPVDVLTRERLSEVWHVDAALEEVAGRTALHVDWLCEASPCEASPGGSASH